MQYYAEGYCKVPVSTLQEARWVSNLVTHYCRLQAAAVEADADTAKALLSTVPDYLVTEIGTMLDKTWGEGFYPSISAAMCDTWEAMIVGNNHTEHLELLEMEVFLAVACNGLKKELSAQGLFYCSDPCARPLGGWAMIADPSHGVRTMTTNQWLAEQQAIAAR